MKRNQQAIQDIQGLIFQAERSSVSLEEIGRWSKLDKKRVASYCRLVLALRQGKASGDLEKPRALRDVLMELANEESGTDPVFFVEEVGASDND